MHDNYTGANPGIGPIAKLPVFLDLHHKRAVLVGGSPGLAWKAELIAAAGADVVVLAEETSEELEALVARGAPAGALRVERRLWRPEDLVGATLAVGDFETADEAACFSAAARQAGVLVNTVDKPASCVFYFGSIVSRSPVIVGISTDGTAPILGQAIRRTVEAVLPRFLADWARLGGELRARVKAGLKPGADRRRFWERLSDLAFAAPPDAAALAGLEAIISGRDGGGAAATGRISMIEARCDNPDCLTMRDMRALLSADYLLADERLPPDLLTVGRREARRERFSSGESADALAARAAHLATGGKHVVVLRRGTCACATASV